MSMPSNIKDREYQKFEEYDGETCVRTKIAGSIDASFHYSGLSKGGKVTNVTINDTTWTPLPETALFERNAISIQNYSGVEIKLNYDDSVVGYNGVILVDKAERFYDVTDGITIYAKSKSGTVQVIVEELA